MSSNPAIATPAATVPWWKFGHVWLVIAGPLIVIVAGFVTLWLAISRPERPRVGPPGGDPDRPPILR